MKNHLKACTAVFFLSALIYGSVHAQTDTSLLELQRGWAEVNYQMEGDAKIDGFEQLLNKADMAMKAAPKDANLLIWAGIINSTYAGAKSGLGALKYAKVAKKYLSKAMDLDPTALDGSAYTSLGTLYGKVPGWPIGFGDDKKAKKMLLKALEINPDGIDSNYFYADFLIDNDDYQQAQKYLHKALLAEPRASREAADEGRRKEIQLALDSIAKEL